MLVYKKQDILNLEFQDTAKAAMEAGLISKEENTAIQKAYPATLYIPNLFLRIGLGILTLIISLAVLGVVFLEIKSGNSYSGIFFFVGAILLVALEIAIHVKGIYQGGIDDVLLHTGIVFILSSIAVRDSTNPALGQAVLSLVACILYLLAFLRYLDRLAIVGAFAGITVLLHAVIIGLLHWPLLVLLSITAIVIAELYLLIGYLLKKQELVNYHPGFRLSKYLLVIGGYACFHLWVAENLYAEYPRGNNLGHPHSGMLLVYWSWTILYPVFVVILGIRKRSRPWIRLGIGLLLSLLLFLQWHEHPMPDELAALIIGLLLIITAYFVIKYLKINDSIFNDRPGRDSAGLDALLPAILLGTIEPAGSNTPQSSTQFGGGSFGGGGAGGEF